MFTPMNCACSSSLKSRKLSESSLSSYIRRAPTPQESIHSSSGRETTPSGHPSSQHITDGTVPILVNNTMNTYSKPSQAQLLTT